MLTDDVNDWLIDSFTGKLLDEVITKDLVVEYFDWWAGYEDAATMLVYSYQEEFFMVYRFYSDMTENEDVVQFQPVKLTLEDALQTIDEFQEIRDSIISY